MNLNFELIPNIEKYMHLLVRKEAYVTLPLEDPKFTINTTLYNSPWTTVDGFQFFRPIPFHRCNETDRLLIYQAEPNWAGQEKWLFNNLYCFDDQNDLLLYGNFNTNNDQSIQIIVEPCILGNKCRDIKELNSTDWPYLYTVTNYQQYKMNNYNTSEMFIKQSELVIHPISLQ